MHWNRIFVALLSLAGASFTLAAEPAKFVSHPPMRALPGPSTRPAAEGPAFYVDGQKGNNAGNGSQAKPWKTVQHGVDQLKPGDTLYLQAGIYYENVKISAQGTAEKPITIRSSPQAMAILDGGFREFFENPAKAWEPVTDGAKGEYRSVKPYPGLEGEERHHSVVFGNFADSMVPIHGYRTLADLRADNFYWADAAKMDKTWAVSCGPGAFYNAETKHIHIRLAHQDQWVFLEPQNRYMGETDPRKMPMIITGGLKGNQIQIAGSSHVRVQDIVFRGYSTPMDLKDSTHIGLEGVTLLAACGRPFRTHNLQGLKMTHCAFRGIAGPWTSRGHMKYRGVEANVFSTYDTEKNQDFDISHSEFTDACDGLFIGMVKNVDFHHNLIDNFSDDGFNVTAILDRKFVGDFGNIHIHQNRLSRCLQMFVFGGRREGHSEQAGRGVFIYRNIIDQRPPVFYFVPTGEKDTAEAMASRGGMMGDHGRGMWEPVHFYHNTVLMFNGALRGDYAGGTALGASRSPEWKVLNNIFVQMEKPVGAHIFSRGDGSNLSTDGNLHWSLQDQSLDTKTFIERLHFDSARIARADGREAQPIEEISRWALHDQVADPKLTRFSGDWREPVDLRLTPESPAVNAGVEIPAEWPDPLRAMDQGKPDLGAIPLGATPPVLPASLTSR